MKSIELNKDIIYDYLNDPHKNLQWGLRFLRIEKLWRIIKKQDLSKVNIAIIDSGMDLLHEDLCDINIIHAYNFIDDNTNIQDDYGHGTAITGVIAATANNNKGIAGIAQNVNIMPLKVIDKNGRAEPLNITRAINWAISHSADIINLSIGTQSSNDLIEKNSYLINNEELIVRKLVNKKITLVSSIGNNKGKSMNFPANLENVISVGAYGVKGRPPQIFISRNNSFSNPTTIFAPGVAIYTSLLNNQYGYVDGSSAACAFVTGSLGVIRSQFDKNTFYDLLHTNLLKSCDIFEDMGKQNLILNVDKLWQICLEKSININ